MVFLFIVNTLSYDCGATVNIAMQLSCELRKQGHTVLAAFRESNDDLMHREYADLFDGCIIVEDNYYNDITKFKSETNWDELNKFRKAGLLLTHPAIIPSWIVFRITGWEKSVIRRYREEIRKYENKHPVDVIAAFNWPHENEEILAGLRTGAKKVVYQMDPYIRNYIWGDEGIAERQREEKSIINRIDKLFVTDLTYRDMCMDEEKYDMGKIGVLKFPGISCESRHKTENKTDVLKETVDLYFIGRLYEDIRNPEWVLKLFEELPSEYILHIVGSGCEDILDRFAETMGDRLVRHGVVTMMGTSQVMSSADILINIGNSIENQLPSKLFEYISAGKPILNICKIDNCPSIGILDRYPLSLTIYEKDGISEETMVSIREFVRTSIGQTVSQEYIMNTYSEYTIDNMAKQLLECVGTL